MFYEDFKLVETVEVLQYARPRRHLNFYYAGRVSVLHSTVCRWTDKLILQTTAKVFVTIVTSILKLCPQVHSIILLI